MFGRLFGKKKEEKTEDDFKLEQSLQKTRTGIFGRISTIFQENQITDELWEELEETLIMGDVGMLTAEELLNRTRERVSEENIKSTSDAYLVLKQEMVRLLQTDEPLHIDEPRILTVVLVVGVRLGCLHHALAAELAIRARGLELAGWVANRIDPGMAAAEESIAALDARLPAPRVADLAWGDPVAPGPVDLRSIGFA